MTKLVVDASVLVELLARQPASASFRAAVEGFDLAAPQHLDAEVLNSLRGLVRSGRLPDTKALAAVRLLGHVVIDRSPLPPLLRRAWTLRDNLTAYDALYVALAQELGCSLLTADRRLARAPGLGIAVTVIDV